MPVTFGFDVRIRIKGHSGRGFFSALEKFLYEEFLQAEKDIKLRLLRTAKEQHKYRHRSRNLRNATKIKGRLSQRKGLRLYVDFEMAPYAGFIITGQRVDPRFGVVTVKTGADPFLTNAVKVNRKWINQRLEKAAGNAVIQYNRMK